MGLEPQYESTTVKVCEEKKPTSLQVWQSVASAAHTRVLVIIVVDLKDKGKRCIDPATFPMFSLFRK